VVPTLQVTLLLMMCLWWQEFAQVNSRFRKYYHDEDDRTEKKRTPRNEYEERSVKKRINFLAFKV